jgi:hypothetical protein
MELVAAATLWGLFSAWLLFPVWGVPDMLRKAAAALLTLEFVTVLAWGYGSEGCTARPCGAGAEAARTAAGLDVPILALALLVLTIAHGVRRRRRTLRLTRTTR